MNSLYFISLRIYDVFFQIPIKMIYNDDNLLKKGHLFSNINKMPKSSSFLLTKHIPNNINTYKNIIGIITYERPFFKTNKPIILINKNFYNLLLSKLRKNEVSTIKIEQKTYGRKLKDFSKFLLEIPQMVIIILLIFIVIHIVPQVDRLLYIKNQIKTYIKKRNDKFFECIICLEKYEVEDKIQVTNCKHNFHERCFSHWIARSNNCPLCKKNILKNFC